MAEERGVRPPYATDSMIRTFFTKMKTMGHPGIIDTKWLESYGLGGSQPTAVIGLLKWLGIIDASNKSTGVWNDLRTNQADTLQGLVRSSYAPVFNAVEVESADRDALNGAFIHAYASGDTAKPMTAFLTLCDLSGISTNAAASRAPSQTRATTKKSAPSAPASKLAAKAAAKPQGQTITQVPIVNHTASATVTFNVEIPGDWDSARVRERVRDVLDALDGSAPPS